MNFNSYGILTISLNFCKCLFQDLENPRSRSVSPDKRGPRETSVSLFLGI